MRTATILFGALTALPMLSQEPVVAKDKVWSDTVKRGDMLMHVRGLGEIVNSRSVALRIAETQVGEVRNGQVVAMDTRQSVVAGKVTRIDSSAANGVVIVDVVPDAPLPAGLTPGLQVDGAILIGKLTDVTYVGRPVFGKAGSQGTLFKIDPDGQRATKVNVRFGRSSVQTIEVLEGLQPGDRVIVSDMSAYANQSRISLQ